MTPESGYVEIQSCQVTVPVSAAEMSLKPKILEARKPWEEN